MFVLNKKTGLKWDVEGELLDRLLKSEDYEVVEIKTESKPETVQDEKKVEVKTKATTKRTSTRK
ncbi:hypothetical protein P9E34_19640 [Schinkia azotoformans]|uniref:hypothetical protein n=1 Tax=Schinkia azotoformans TaxID=1454 RepID=UPI002DBD1713|nr:hypothetical protein [Schinkia azotoformans]MEC1726925.1 hypothetical protein [Schinkia azotoformans]